MRTILKKRIFLNLRIFLEVKKLFYRIFLIFPKVRKILGHENIFEEDTLKVGCYRNDMSETQSPEQYCFFVRSFMNYTTQPLNQMFIINQT